MSAVSPRLNNPSRFLVATGDKLFGCGSGHDNLKMSCYLLSMTLSQKISVIWRFANPSRFSTLVDRSLIPISLVAAALLTLGLVWGFFYTPDERVQGASVKILFVHVPTATVAINAWFVMLVASLIWLIRRHHVSALLARAAAPVGLTMALCAMVSGAAWGSVTWGTAWAWEPRLVAFLILCFFYAGYIALWNAIEDRERAADFTSMLCIVGSAFAVLSRYAVDLWARSLHQPSSLSLDSEENIHDTFYYPLVVVILGFLALFLALVLLRTRTEIRMHKISVRRLRARHA